MPAGAGTPGEGTGAQAAAWPAYVAYLVRPPLACLLAYPPTDLPSYRSTTVTETGTATPPLDSPPTPTVFRARARFSSFMYVADLCVGGRGHWALRAHAVGHGEKPSTPTALQSIVPCAMSSSEPAQHLRPAAGASHSGMDTARTRALANRRCPTLSMPTSSPRGGGARASCASCVSRLVL